MSRLHATRVQDLDTGIAKPFLLGHCRSTDAAHVMWRIATVTEKHGRTRTTFILATVDTELGIQGFACFIVCNDCQLGIRFFQQLLQLPFAAVTLVDME